MPGMLDKNKKAAIKQAGEKPRPYDSERVKRQRRLPEIAELYITGMSQPEIARRYNLTDSTITRDLQEIRAQWLSAAVDSYAELKSMELARLDKLELAAWAGYARSQNDAEKQLIVAEPVAQNENEKELPRAAARQTIRIEKRIEKQTGDVGWLSLILDIIKRRCAIFGFDAPKKIAPTPPDGPEPYQPINDDERVRRVLELFNGTAQTVADAIAKAQEKTTEE